jgi:hypothetical protein
MYKAAFLSSDFDNPALTAKELKAYLRGSAKLLIGNDQRKSKNTPYPDKIHLVGHSFSTFRHLFKTNDRFQSSTLYVFDDRINSTHFFLKYTSRAVCHFDLDEQVIDQMNKISWDYGHLTRYRQSLQSDLDSLDFFITKQIGDSKFHKTFPAHVTSSQKFILKIDNEIEKLETKAKLLFKSGWS